jgi:hypothetical protein
MKRAPNGKLIVDQGNLQNIEGEYKVLASFVWGLF